MAKFTDLTLNRRSVLKCAGVALVAARAAPLLSATTAPMSTKTGRSMVRGQAISWRSEAGETAMYNAAGAPRATIFSVSYIADQRPSDKRPVTFLWNGGPGGASWEIRENLAPRMTVASPGSPGFAFVDNVSSILDVTDLVFIDAPGTGFSRILDPSAEREYWGVEEDGRAFADFIAGWVRQHGREASPHFLIAESYGGTRAGQVVRNLAENNLSVRGVTLVSPTLSPLGGPNGWFQSYSPALLLPAMAAVAHYHQKGAYQSRGVGRVWDESLAFARGEYGSAIARKAELSSAQRQSIISRVAGFAGVPETEVSDSDLVVPVERFSEALLRDRREVVEVSDGRKTQPAPPPGQKLSPLTPNEGYDRSTAIVSMIRDELGYTSVEPYRRDPRKISAAWNQVTRRENRTNVILARQMASDPKLRVLEVGGCYDLIVPFAASLSVLRGSLPSDRFEHHFYESGHGVYGDMPLRPRTTDDLRAFYRRTLA